MKSIGNEQSPRGDQAASPDVCIPSKRAHKVRRPFFKSECRGEGTGTTEQGQARKPPGALHTHQQLFPHGRPLAGASATNFPVAGLAKIREKCRQRNAQRAGKTL